MHRSISPRFSEAGKAFWGLTSFERAGSNGAKTTTGTAGVGAEGGLVVLTETLHGVMGINPAARFSVTLSGSASLSKKKTK